MKKASRGRKIIFLRIKFNFFTASLQLFKCSAVVVVALVIERPDNSSHFYIRIKSSYCPTAISSKYRARYPVVLSHSLVNIVCKTRKQSCAPDLN
jgi:hypothetical protein